MKLPARFQEPMTADTMAELLAYQELLNSEVQRVANVCAYWKRNGLCKSSASLRAWKVDRHARA